MFEEIASIYFFVTKSVKTDKIQVHLLDVDMLLIHFRSCLAFLSFLQKSISLQYTRVLLIVCALGGKNTVKSHFWAEARGKRN